MYLATIVLESIIEMKKTIFTVCGANVNLWSVDLTDTVEFVQKRSRVMMKKTAAFTVTENVNS